MIIACPFFCMCDQIEGPNSCVHPRIILWIIWGVSQQFLDA